MTWFIYEPSRQQWFIERLINTRSEAYSHPSHNWRYLGTNCRQGIWLLQGFVWSEISPLLKVLHKASSLCAFRLKCLSVSLQFYNSPRAVDQWCDLLQCATHLALVDRRCSPRISGHHRGDEGRGGEGSMELTHKSLLTTLWAQSGLNPTNPRV